MFRHFFVDIIVASNHGYRLGAFGKWAAGVEEPLSTALGDFSKRGILVGFSGSFVWIVPGLMGGLGGSQRSLVPTWAWNLVCRIPNKRWRLLCDSDKVSQISYRALPILIQYREQIMAEVNGSRVCELNLAR